MSELKVYRDLKEGPCWREFYEKSEADKVIAELEEAQHWRKFSEERPKDKQWILVFVENPSKYGTYIELRRWDMGCKFDVEEQELYTLWMPLPKAPESKELAQKFKEVK